MGKMSRIKGASFERYIAKDLSLLYYGDATILRRTPLSGGWGAKYAGGDIAGLEDFPLYVECKNRESWKTSDLFNLNSVLYRWYVDVCEKASTYKKIPILVFTRNYEIIYCMCKEDLPAKGPKIIATEHIYIYTYEDWKTNEIVKIGHGIYKLKKPGVTE